MNERPYIYAGGTFDLLHPGHVSFLEACNVMGRVVVAVNSDSFAAKYKRKPVMTFEERCRMVGALECVNLVTVNSGNYDSSETIDHLIVQGIQIRMIAHGDDWTGAPLMEQMGITEDWLKSRDIKLVYVPYTEGVSTSEIIGRIEAWQPTAA